MCKGVYEGHLRDWLYYGLQLSVKQQRRVLNRQHYNKLMSALPFMIKYNLLVLYLSAIKQKGNNLGSVEL